MDRCFHQSSKGLINAGIGIHFLESWPRNPKMILDFCWEASGFAVAPPMGAPLSSFHAGLEHPMPPCHWPFGLIRPGIGRPRCMQSGRPVAVPYGIMELDASGWLVVLDSVGLMVVTTN